MTASLRYRGMKESQSGSAGAPGETTSKTSIHRWFMILTLKGKRLVSGIYEYIPAPVNCQAYDRVQLQQL